MTTSPKFVALNVGDGSMLSVWVSNGKREKVTVNPTVVLIAGK